MIAYVTGNQKRGFQLFRDIAQSEAIKFANKYIPKIEVKMYQTNGHSTARNSEISNDPTNTGGTNLCNRI